MDSAEDSEAMEATVAAADGDSFIDFSFLLDYPCPVGSSLFPTGSACFSCSPEQEMIVFEEETAI